MRKIRKRIIAQVRHRRQVPPRSPESKPNCEKFPETNEQMKEK